MPSLNPTVSAHERSHELPHQLSLKGWWHVIRLTQESMGKDFLALVSSGVAFYLLLSLFPGIAALVALYGLLSDPQQVQQQLEGVRGMMPDQVYQIIHGQVTAITTQTTVAGWSAVVSITLALWGASRATKGMMQALNLIYHEEETRGFIRTNLIGFGLMVGITVAGIIAIGAVVALPPIMSALNLPGWSLGLISFARWVLLFAMVMGVLALLYSVGPDRKPPHWQWNTWGAAIATILWIIGSGLFSWYVANFNSYNKTYGSLGAVVILMMWLYLSAFVALLGAEVNDALEKETGKRAADARK
ncbi:MAG: YihY/virulence factor BrkB family protein [Verrucomicrobiota bacterium JB022]|nr:YihY/virulence factor BrkB family protein [Verrucomicrobiota bacterium JB022]